MLHPEWLREHAWRRAAGQGFWKEAAPLMTRLGKEAAPDPTEGRPKRKRKSNATQHHIWNSGIASGVYEV